MGLAAAPLDEAAGVPGKNCAEVHLPNVMTWIFAAVAIVVKSMEQIRADAKMIRTSRWKEIFTKGE